MEFKKILIIAISLFLVAVVVAGSIFGYLFFRNEAKAEENYYYNLGEMYSNLEDTNRILRFNLTISVSNEDLITIFDKKNFLIKDELYKILRNKTTKEIQGRNGQLELKKQVVNNLKETFGTEDIKNIYFNELIVQ